MAVTLDKKRWRGFLEDRLSPGEARALAARLRAGCTESEDFLADLGGDPADLIHGVRDDLRAAGAPDGAPLAGAALDEEEIGAACAAVMERVRSAGVKAAPRHLRPWHEALPFSILSVDSPPMRVPHNDDLRRRVGMAVGGLLTIGLALMFGPARQVQERYSGAKGRAGAKGAVTSSADTLGVALSFAIARSGKVIRPGRTGVEVGADADLLFRFRVTGGPAYVYLVRVQGGSAELVWPPAGAPARRIEGEADLEVDGVVQGVSMAGLSGSVHFVAVASGSPLERPADGPWAEAGTDTVNVRVRAAAE